MWQHKSMKNTILTNPNCCRFRHAALNSLKFKKCIFVKFAYRPKLSLKMQNSTQYTVEFDAQNNNSRAKYSLLFVMIVWMNNVLLWRRMSLLYIDSTTPSATMSTQFVPCFLWLFARARWSRESSRPLVFVFNVRSNITVGHTVIICNCYDADIMLCFTLNHYLPALWIKSES